MKPCLLFVGFCLLAGCSSPTTPAPLSDAGPECPAIGLALGEKTPNGFMPFSDGQTVGVVLGFQGFRFIDGAARLTGADPQSDLGLFRFQISFQAHDPIVQDRAVPLVLGPDGALWAEGVQIFFNDIPMAELLDEFPRLDAIVKVDGCPGSQSLSLHLKDGGDCADLAPDGGGACGDPTDAGLGDAGP